jgi:alcohol dehydrogenase
MKTQAAVLVESGRARPYRDTKPLVIEQVELDDPGPGEVRVKVTAAGLCHSDLSTIDGSRPRPVPMVLGHEAAGIVEEVGRDVTDLEPGDHVVFSFVPMCGRCVPCLSGRPALCERGARANGAGTLLGGGCRFHAPSLGDTLYHHLGVSAFSEYTVVSIASCVKIDPTVPLDRAALFGCAMVTGVGAVINTAQAQAGNAVAVFGLGGVGLAAIMGAQLAGCHPIIAVDRVEAKMELAKSLGATASVKAGDDTVAMIRDLTSGGVDYAFEAVGNADVLAQAYAATRRGGKTVTIGLPHPSQVLKIQAVSLVAEERTIMGSYMGSAVPNRDVPRLISLYRAGKLPVDALFSGTISIDEVNAAFDELAGGAPVRQVMTFGATPASVENGRRAAPPLSVANRAGGA